MKFLILLGLIAFCCAEAPLNGYPASGWKPQGESFNLPTEYGAPQQQPGASEIEITKENIVYVGQLGESTTTLSAGPSNTYLPPTTTTPEDETLLVQGLPQNGAANFVRAPLRAANFRQPAQQSFAKFRQAPQQQQQQQRFVQQQRFAQQQRYTQQPQQQQQRYTQQPQQQQQRFTQKPSEFSEFIPRSAAQPVNNNFRNGRIQNQPRQNINFQRQEIQPQGNPAPEYGPPQPEYGAPVDVPQINEEIQPEDSTENEEDSTEDSEPAVAISNASNGQYYILAPDNTLQKVNFMTSQTEDDRRNNGFTAQLRYGKLYFLFLITFHLFFCLFFKSRYAPVEPIRDPIYGYNEQGQLVRIYNRKK